MSKSGKLVVGIITIWPLIYIVIIFSIFLLSIPNIFSNSDPSSLNLIIPSTTVIHFITFFLMIGLLIGYIRHVYRNNKVAPGDRLAWAAILILGSVISQFIYWYIYIWKNNK